MGMLKLAQGTETEGRVSAPGLIAGAAAEFGLKVANEAEIRTAREIAARLISEYIATAETFIAVQAITHASIFVYTEGRAITGMMGFFPLRSAGLRALQAGMFNAIAPDLDLIARPGEIPAACYGWGFAGTTDVGAGAAVKASVAIRNRLFWKVPVFTRAATADGVRVIQGKMGYQVYSASDPSLVWLPASTAAPRL